MAVSVETTETTPKTARDLLALGVRGRVIFVVTIVALLLSVTLTVVTITVAEDTLIATREDSLAVQAFSNAQTVDGALGTGDILFRSSDAGEIQSMLTSLPDGGVPSLILNQPGGGSINVSVDARYGIDVLPQSLITAVVINEQPSVMRFESGGQSLVAVGIPLEVNDAFYFQVNQLTDISTALTRLQIFLVFATIVASLLAAVLGVWSSRYAVRPLKRINQATEAVARGNLDTRILESDYENDADLSPLVQNFNAMVSALQERIDRDARFASDVSHELRSPLTTLNASIGVVENNRDALSERAQSALDLLVIDIQRFTQLVEDLLEISRFDAGAVRLELDTVAIVPLVEATVRTTNSGDVEVISDPELDGVVVACDKRRVVRVIVNFLDNARKYADGATAVYVHRHDETTVEGDDEPHATIEIAVEDRGPGVPKAERSRIFDRFNRGDQGGSRGTDLGVGLGLALAAEHARIQGGDVWVEDRHDGGQGARFVISLPLIIPVEEEELTGDELDTVSRDEADIYALTGELPAIEKNESQPSSGSSPRPESKS